jgi:hypothetical protein
MPDEPANFTESPALTAKLLQTLRLQLRHLRKAGLSLVFHPERVASSLEARVAACIRASVELTNPDSNGINQELVDAAVMLILKPDNNKQALDTARRTIQRTVLADKTVIEEIRLLVEEVSGLTLELPTTSTRLDK